METARVVVVDWGARSTPWPVGATPNAPWVAVADRGCPVAILGPDGLGDVRNHPTRHATIDAVEAAVVEETGTVLVAVDACLGFPAGLAGQLGLAAPRRLWALLEALVDDAPDNANNRFEVAADLNARLRDSAGPFWGTPSGVDLPGVPARQEGIVHGPGGHTFGRRRTCEVAVPRTQPVFKLAYPGSVGSQTLLALPHLAALLRRLGGRGRQVSVWPFDPLPAGPGAVVLAEVYPSMFVRGRPHSAAAGVHVADAHQVAWSAEHLRTQAPRHLAASAQLPDVAGEEGWILGVQPGAPPGTSR